MCYNPNIILPFITFKNDSSILMNNFRNTIITLIEKTVSINFITINIHKSNLSSGYDFSNLSIMKYPVFICLLVLVSYGALGQNKIPKSISVKAIPFKLGLLDDVKSLRLLSNNSLLLEAAKETDLHIPASGSYDRHNAPKLLFKPDSNFEFSAHIIPSFQEKYDGGAILVYTNAQNWAKILIQYTGSKYLLGMSVVRNKITDDAYYEISNQKHIFLKVAKQDNVFQFYSSLDGKKWNLMREFKYEQPENFKVGFYSQSPIGASCKVEYADITYAKK